MNPSNKMEQHVQDPKEEDLVKRKWLSDIMSILLEYLLNIFIEQTSFHPTHFPPNPRKYTYIGDLTPSFYLAYPDLYGKLEILMRKLPEPTWFRIVL